MNLVKHSSSNFIAGIFKTKIFLLLLNVTSLSVYLAGCNDRMLHPSAEQLAVFENAGPARPSIDWDRLVSARMDRGPYRAVPGDLLKLTMPAILQAAMVEVPRTTEEFAPYLCRISEDGTIVLPMIGKIEAAGKSLPEIESAIIEAYYPRYTVLRPSVTAQVTEYRTAKVSITGAVENPGVYDLRRDQMSLVALLMEAGGIVDQGAAHIRIIRSNGTISTSKQRVAVQLSFEQIQRSSTKGLLIIRNNQSILLVENLDIADQTQQQAVLEKLEQQEQRIQIPLVKEKLCALAELIQADTVRPESKTGAYAQLISTTVNKTLSDFQQSTTSDESLERLQEVFKKLEQQMAIKKISINEEETAKKHEPIVLPVRGLNIPFADVDLNEGDTVVVEPLQVPIFTIIGLVNKPGNFPYPPDAQYNLVQAIAFAGGLDRDTEPRYAAIYRLKEDGSIIRTPFQIITTTDGSQLTEALNIAIKPGDIIAVEDTPRTRANAFLQRIFRFQVGAYVPLPLYR